MNRTPGNVRHWIRAGRLLTAIFGAIALFILFVPPATLESAGASGASSFSGTTVDPNGNPVAGTTIELTDSSGNQFTTTSATDGSFSLTVNPGVYSLDVLVDGQVDFQAGSVDLSQQSVSETLTLPATRPFTVEVVDENGNPVPGGVAEASFSCSLPSVDIQPGVPASWNDSGVEWISPPWPPTANASGDIQWTLVDCPSGQYTVLTDIDDNGYTTQGTIPTSGFVTALLPPDNPIVSGSLGLADGDAISSGNVTLSQPNSRTFPPQSQSTTGAFSLKADGIGSYELSESLGFGVNGNSSMGLSGTLNVVTDQDFGNEELPTVPVTVVVTDSSGQPVVNATVQASGNCNTVDSAAFPSPFNTFTISSGTDASTVTDSSGDATFPDLLAPCNNAAITFKVIPSSNDLAQTVVTAPTNLTGPATVNITLSSDISFSGTTVDPNGNPVAGTTIELTDSSGNQFTTTSATDGSFSLTVNPGVYSLDVLVDGQVDFQAGSVDLSQQSVSETLTLPATRPFTVEVVDENGNPVPGGVAEASFSCSLPSVDIQPGVPASWNDSGVEWISPPWPPTANASGDIQWTLVDCPSGQYTVLTDIDDNGYTTQGTIPTSGFVTALLPPDNPIVSGSLGLADGDAISSGNVTLSQPNSRTFPPQSQSTTGAFSLKADGIGSYELSESLGFGVNGNSSMGLSGTLNVVTDQDFGNEELPTVPVTVVVTDSSGQPVVNATVQASGNCNTVDSAAFPSPFNTFTISSGTDASTVTDSSGDATFPDLLAPCNNAAITFKVIPSSNDLAQTVVTAPTNLTGPATVNITLSSDISFSGTTVDPNGNPVAGTTIELTDSSGNQFTTTSATDGSFSLTVNPGVYSLDVLVDGQVDFQAGSVDLSQQSVSETLTLPATRPFTVEVVDENGNPVPGGVAEASFSCSLPSVDIQPGVPASWNDSGVEWISPPWPPTANASGDIQWTLVDCPSGQYTVLTDIDDNGYTTQGTIPTSGFVTALLPPDNPIVSGSLGLADGDAISSGNVTLSQPNSRTFPPQSQSTTGAFSLKADGIGSYELSESLGFGVNGNSSMGLSGTLNVVTDQDFGNEELPTVPVTVVVTDSSGQPVVNATVQASGNCNTVDSAAFPSPFNTFTISSGTDASTVTDSSGDATFPDLLAPCNNAAITFKVIPSSNDLAQTVVTAPTNLTGPATVNITLGTLDGTVVDSANQPLSGQQVQLLSAAGKVVAQDETTTSGSFGLDVASGTYTAVLSGSIGDPTMYKVTAPRFKVAHPESLTLTVPTRQIYLEVVTTSGEDVEGATIKGACSPVAFQAFGKPSHGTQCINEHTNSSGNANVELVGNASIRLTITPPKRSGLKATTVTLEGTATGSVTVTLNRKG